MRISDWSSDVCSSDLHFGKTDALLIEPLRDELLRAAPDLVVVSGDLTLAARNREFAEAASFLRDLPASCFVVPGTHDIPSYQAMERFIEPFRRWRRHIGPDMERPEGRRVGEGGGRTGKAWG